MVQVHAVAIRSAVCDNFFYICHEFIRGSVFMLLDFLLDQFEIHRFFDVLEVICDHINIHEFFEWLCIRVPIDTFE